MSACSPSRDVVPLHRVEGRFATSPRFCSSANASKRERLFWESRKEKIRCLPVKWMTGHERRLRDASQSGFCFCFFLSGNPWIVPTVRGSVKLTQANEQATLRHPEFLSASLLNPPTPGAERLPSAEGEIKSRSALDIEWPPWTREDASLPRVPGKGSSDCEVASDRESPLRRAAPS